MWQLGAESRLLYLVVLQCPQLSLQQICNWCRFNSLTGTFRKRSWESELWSLICWDLGLSLMVLSYSYCNRGKNFPNKTKSRNVGR